MLKRLDQFSEPFDEQNRVLLFDEIDRLDKIDEASLVPVTRTAVRLVEATRGVTAAAMRSQEYLAFSSATPAAMATPRAWPSYPTGGGWSPAAPTASCACGTNG